MKKFMFAAVAALFVVSAHANEAAKAPAAPANEKDCMTAKGTWDAATKMCKMEAAPAAPAKK